MKYNKNWYSVITAIFIIWFLFVLTASILKLVLVELNDNRWRDNYLKAFYAAEASGEYAMLKIKENWYWYYSKMDLDKSDNESIILSLDNVYKWWRDPLIWYDINSKVNKYTWDLPSISHDVIPLFYSDDTISNSAITEMILTVNSWDAGSLSWNIVSATWWLSWVWWFSETDLWLYKALDWVWNFVMEDKKIKDFLVENSNNFNYLVLFNSGDSNVINYTLDWKWWFFSRPRTDIQVSGKIWDYKQNLSIKYDNTDYLGLLKYSVFSE